MASFLVAESALLMTGRQAAAQSSSSSRSTRSRRTCSRRRSRSGPSKEPVKRLPTSSR